MNGTIVARKNSFKIPIIAISLIIVGIVFSALFFKNWSIYTSSSKSYIQTDATVVDHTYKSGVAVSSTIEYTVNDKSYQTASSKKSVISKPYGYIVKIKYNPTNPNDIIFVGEKPGLFSLCIGLFTFSLGTAIVIVSFIRTAKRMKNKNGIIQEAPKYDTILEGKKKKGKNKDKPKKRRILDNINMNSEINNIPTSMANGYDASVNYINNNDLQQFSINQELNNDTNYSVQTENNTFTNEVIDIPFVNNAQPNLFENNNIDSNINIEPIISEEIKPVVAETVVEPPLEEKIDLPIEKEIKPLSDSERIHDEISKMQTNSDIENELDSIPSFIPNIDEVKDRLQ